MAFVVVVWTATPSSALYVWGAAWNNTGNAIGVKSTISEPQTAYNGSLQRAYFIGTTLPNGDFMQAGYWDASSSDGTCSGGKFGWFVAWLDDDGTSIWTDAEEVGGCGLTGNRTFELDRVSYGTGYLWQWTVSGSTIGDNMAEPNGQFAKSTVGYASEVLGTFTSHPLISLTEYHNAAQVKLGNGTWTTLGGMVYYDSPDAVCPPYYEKVLGTADAQIGYNSSYSGTCYSIGDTLW